MHIPLTATRRTRLFRPICALNRALMLANLGLVDVLDGRYVLVLATGAERDF